MKLFRCSWSLSACFREFIGMLLYEVEMYIISVINHSVILPNAGSILMNEKNSENHRYMDGSFRFRCFVCI